MRRFLLLSVLAFAQQSQAQTFETLDGNNIYTPIDTTGILFRVGSVWDSRYEVPAGSGRKMGMYTAPGIVGKNGSGLVRGAFTHNFRPGPLKESIATPSSNPAAWKKVWKVTANDIYDHLANYSSSGYVPIPAIATWPAQGDPAFGEPASIAPYVDLNSDGVYNPLDGDYPKIKGAQSIFFVFNDYSPTGMGMEIHCMAYVFDCNTDSALFNTVFVNYEFVNRSTSHYTDTYIGLFTDLDLGYFLDDYMGSDVGRGLIYGYNGDTYDQPSGMAMGYENTLPVQGITILGGPNADADGADNLVYSTYASATANGGICYPAQGLYYADGITDNERLGMSHFMAYTGIGAPNANMSDPNNLDELHLNFSGLWKDASTLNYGGAGYPGLSGVTTTQADFSYSDGSDPFMYSTHGVTVSADWNEISAGNTPGDRRGICSAGPFSMSPGEVNELDVAFITAFDYTTPLTPLDALDELMLYTDEVRSAFVAGTTPCGDFIFSSTPETETAEMNISIYPNPAGSELNIQLQDNALNTAFNIYDVYGKLVTSGTIGGNKKTITLSHLVDGIYLINIQGMGTKRFRVQH